MFQIVRGISSNFYIFIFVLISCCVVLDKYCNESAVTSLSKRTRETETTMETGEYVRHVSCVFEIRKCEETFVCMNFYVHYSYTHREHPV